MFCLITVMEQVANVSEAVPSSEGKNPLSNATQEDPIVSSSISLEERAETLNNNDEHFGSKTSKTDEICDTSEDRKKNENLNKEEHEEEESDEYASDDDFEFDDAFDDDSMDLSNFGLNDPRNVTIESGEGDNSTITNDSPSQSCATSVNKEQEKMELFWKLLDMGFSRGNK